jgi:Uma2 family endonuclease
MATARDICAQSLADFLAWEQQQPERYERVGGIIRMMTGGTIAHNRITRNCARALETSLQDSDCEVFTSDVKVTTPAENVLYPDVLVACGEIAGKATRIETPVVVVEVLSESTAERDHGRKRWAYQTIPSLQHYVLIGQDEPAAEVASRADDGSWRSVIHRGLNARLRLEGLGVEVGLAEIFARIGFASESGERSPSQVQA